VLFAIVQSTAEKVGLESWVPNNLVGVLTAISVGGLLIEKLVNRGKKQGVDESTVNGMGVRITKVEADNKRLEGQFQEHQRSVDRVLLQNEGLLKEIGKAENAASRCGDDMERYTIQVGAKVDDMRRELSGKIGDLTVQLEGVKTEVRLRAQFEERDRREP
jgi:hypothetical protein